MPSVRPIAFGFQRFAKAVLRIVFKLLLRCRVTGIENVPASGRLVVIMNHINFLDPILVTATLPRDIAIMSKIENLEMPVLGKIIQWYGSFPVRRGELDLGAVRISIEVLESECALLLAPEGTRSKNAKLQPAYDGMALVTTRASAPVLPVAISGAEGFASNIKRLRRTPVTLAIGEPFVFVTGDRHVSRLELRQMTQEAMRRIASLLPDSYRGLYADPDKEALQVTALFTGALTAREKVGAPRTSPR